MGSNWKNKRRVSKRKNNARKRMMRPKRMGLRQPVHYFKRSVFTANALSVTAGATAFDAGVFRLSSLPDASDFTALYDQYRIRAIKWELLPRGNSVDLGTAGSQQTRLFSVIDYDDGVIPTSIGQLTQYQNLKVTSTTQKHVRYFRPMIRREIQIAPGSTGHEPTRAWIDMTNSTVDHFGVKLALQGPVSGTITYDVLVTYYLAFKNVR